MGEAEQEQRERIETEAKRLVSSIADLQDSLFMKLENTPNPEGGDLEAVCYANSALLAFAESKYTLQAAKPRSIRERDRERLLPGQHSGAYLQFEIPQEGTILIVNFKGGLRVLSSVDYQDLDVSGVKPSHTKTTDKVLSQPVEINWQLNFLGGPQIDCWLVLNQEKGSFRLDKLNVGEEKIDVHPTLQRGEPNTDTMRTSLLQAIKNLTSYIPSSS